MADNTYGYGLIVLPYWCNTVEDQNKSTHFEIIVFGYQAYLGIIDLVESDEGEEYSGTLKLSKLRNTDNEEVEMLKQDSFKNKFS